MWDAELIGHHEGNIDFTRGSYEFRVTHPSGRIMHFKVKANDTLDGSVIIAHLVNGIDESFIHPDARSAIVEQMESWTSHDVKWAGYVDA